MNAENPYTDIFTEFDDSIFSDGSIDPMGLRVIWTSLGNAIFHNKLNTISTDIRYYTINLFHHYVIQNAEKKNEEKIWQLLGRKPYYNKQDLNDGLIIFLESLLTHAVYTINASSKKEYTVPGISKLSAIIAENANDHRAVDLTVDRNAGILVRQILLGIHGRHKGPFQQMGIFTRHDYYSNKVVWEETKGLFKERPWKLLAERLEEIISKKVFSGTLSKKGRINLRVEDVLNKDLQEQYAEMLRVKNFQKPELTQFWESRLGLRAGAARILYDELKAYLKETDGDHPDFEVIIKKSAIKGEPENNKYIKAICAIEPLIARIEKTAHRLLQRGTTEINSHLQAFVENVFADENIDLPEIQKYINEEYLSPEAHRRLKELYRIYTESVKKKDPVLFIRSLINYHKNIMDSRSNIAWLSIGTKNRITQHRSFNYTNGFLRFLENNRWVNDYYLSTVYSLYKGLHQI